MPTNKRDLFYTVKEKQIPRFARHYKKAGSDSKAGSDRKAGSDGAVNYVRPHVAIVFG
jgi:hypothetical protein